MAAIGDWANFFICDEIVAVCEPMKEFCERFLRSLRKDCKVKKVILELPEEFKRINFGNIREEIKKLAEKCKEKYFFIASSLREVYNWKFTIRFAKEIEKKGLLLFIAGSGPSEKKIKELIKEYNVRNVKLLGWINLDEVKLMTKNSKGVIAFVRRDLAIYVTWENTTKLQEALAFNKPIITSWLEDKEKGIYRINKPEEILKLLNSF